MSKNILKYKNFPIQGSRGDTALLTPEKRANIAEVLEHKEVDAFAEADVERSNNFKNTKRK